MADNAQNELWLFLTTDQTYCCVLNITSVLNNASAHCPVWLTQCVRGVNECISLCKAGVVQQHFTVLNAITLRNTRSPICKKGTEPKVQTTYKAQEDVHKLSTQSLLNTLLPEFGPWYSRAASSLLLCQIWEFGWGLSFHVKTLFWLSRAEHKSLTCKEDVQSEN